MQTEVNMQTVELMDRGTVVNALSDAAWAGTVAPGDNLD